MKISVLIAAVVLVLAAPFTLAQQGHEAHHPADASQAGTMMRGMMGGGMGRGMGMMDDQGMMGRGMGMMHGKCPMMGMMGGGMGMMHGLGPISMLDLTDEQREEIRKIRSELRREHWDTMGKMMDEMETLRELYAADQRDPAAIGEAHERLFNLRRPMIEAMVEASNQIQALLTDEQREQLKQLRRGMGKMQGKCPMMGPMGDMDMMDMEY